MFRIVSRFSDKAGLLCAGCSSSNNSLNVCKNNLLKISNGRNCELRGSRIVCFASSNFIAILLPALQELLCPFICECWVARLVGGSLTNGY